MDLPRNFLFLALFMSKALSIATVNNNSVCSLIAAQLGNKVSLPSGNTYKLSIQSYWYQQERLSPSCVVSPTNSKDVSSIVNILTEARNGSEDAPMLSIRSGGHAPLPGAANNNGGVTIDMRGLANVKVSPGRNMVSVGAGAIWSDVYDRLVPMNLTVLGARVADLGVGGLLTGGKCQLPKLKKRWLELITWIFRRYFVLLTTARVRVRSHHQYGNCSGKRSHN